MDSYLFTDSKAMRVVRKDISMIFQEPTYAPFPGIYHRRTDDKAVLHQEKGQKGSEGIVYKKRWAGMPDPAEI